MKRSRTGTTDVSKPKENENKPQSHNPPKIPKWKDALAGASAGAFSKTAMAPVERVKLLMQLQGSVTHNNNGAKNFAGYGPWKVALHIYESEGFFALWRGNWPNLLRTAGQAALNFSFMDYYKSLAHSPVLESAVVSTAAKGHTTTAATNTTTEELQRRRQLIVSFVSGGLAGATSTTALYPTEYLRTRLAMDQGGSLEVREYRNMRDCFVKTVRTDGILGVYQGYGIALWGSVLYRLLYLGGYDVIKNEIIRGKEGQKSSITLGERFLIAQGVSITAGTICYPIDSVRRRLMMQAGKTLDQRLYRGSLHCFREVWSKEGLRGFYLGLSPNLVRSIGGALMLVAYDAMKTVI
jgi:solute carrier family 25 (adenine nucleotide translocator) protein 4/5/6/31